MKPFNVSLALLPVHVYFMYLSAYLLKTQKINAN